MKKRKKERKMKKRKRGVGDSSHIFAAVLLFERANAKELT